MRPARVRLQRVYAETRAVEARRMTLTGTVVRLALIDSQRVNGNGNGHGA